MKHLKKFNEGYTEKENLVDRYREATFNTPENTVESAKRYAAYVTPIKKSATTIKPLVISFITLQLTIR